MLDPVVTHKKWDENDSESFVDNDDGHILLKRGVTIKC